MCKKHSLRNSGQFQTISQAEQLELFWSYVDKMPEHWMWTGPVNDEGYVRFAIKGLFDNDNQKMAHVISFVLAGGIILSGHQIDHTCRIRKCIRPECLEQVTAAINVQRSSVAKLNQLEVCLIRKSRKNGDRVAEIAEKFQISKPHVYRITNNERWK